MIFRFFLSIYKDYISNINIEESIFQNQEIEIIQKTINIHEIHRKILQMSSSQYNKIFHIKSYLSFEYIYISNRIK